MGCNGLSRQHRHITCQQLAPTDAPDCKSQHLKAAALKRGRHYKGEQMWNWTGFRPLGLAVVALSISACSTSYDCSSNDVTASLVEQAAHSGFIPYMKDAPADWVSKLADHTTTKNVVTLDANDEIHHFRCRANLEYREGARTVTSKDVTYEVRKIEGEEDFTLEWEVENNGITDIDPIKMFAFDVQLPWKGALEKQQEVEHRAMVNNQKHEAKAWAPGYAAEYAAKNPPLPFSQEALKKYFDDYLGSRDVERVLEQFHDIDGDGFIDYLSIVANHEYNKGEFAEETENYGQYTNTGGFMSKTYFLIAVTQTFQGFGIATNMGVRDDIRITTADGEKVTEKYLPREISTIAKPPANPITGVTNRDGLIVVSLANGESVTIDTFKPEKTLQQMQQDRLLDLENRLAYRRENGSETDSLYE